MQYSFKDFLPLIAMIAIVIGLTFLFNTLYSPVDWMHCMRHFMGSFFLVFGGLKLIKIKAFAMAYKEYDVLAMRSNFYAYLYPFLELALGLAFILNFVPMVTNWFTVVLMSVSALGVYLKLRKKEEVPCACLGMVFKVPMTWVTLVEDLLMVGMALTMIII